ncbi:MauE/DoxX family redox-associated membrane protein [Demequina lignilytica]|uniref:MauE/DoxX family redox-associated membrane protein n=1 Tax=Demequina lignilytica TaxID=3051663 RepID=A0AAW7M9P4_9MICO|nr:MULTISPECIES: MauE/DoxX family redox-associated membrane protein [unclassified Demequina]MDN4477497.1 MauE/DoxX family redox-associated membrane protein [Demequina sp. SYSU T00039-1]MDN4483541.1 MauE/DoxX family redox-associated membrane protein [Demequina sp. SYSU T0a273]MDN4488152.1 MauE/DoxX family redox-associated membrane protein [Demequina sp. SYSU T00039]MDN4490593.1 MauE/DoxX family redox-associated membrane protein [Demequina sp. SYSU T00068]
MGVDTDETTDAQTSRWHAIQPWLSTVVRLGMAVILIAAAIPKMLDIPQSIIAVRAYRLLPEAVVPLVGTMLPFLELALAVFLILGLFTRLSSIAWLLMMAAFSTGVIWAWSQGYSIDCGCFGGGGDVAEGTTNYPLHMLERLGFIVLGTYLLIWPRSRFSLDGWMKAA